MSRFTRMQSKRFCILRKLTRGAPDPTCMGAVQLYHGLPPPNTIMGEEGLEPSRGVTPIDPKSILSTNSSTRPNPLYDTKDAP